LVNSIKEPLHPGFFTGRSIFLDDPLSGSGINFLDHLFERRLRFTKLFFLSENHKFLCARPDGTFYRLILDTPFFALPMPLERGTVFACQRKILLPSIFSLFLIPVWLQKATWVMGKSLEIPYLKSEGRRSKRLHFSHSATFLTLPFSKRVFILTSPPQEEQKNFCVALDVREFLL
jgi:hypothetical protein